MGNDRWAIREGDWKLLGNPIDTSRKGRIKKEDKLFLVNLKKDVSEMKNLASDYPKKSNIWKKCTASGKNLYSDNPNHSAMYTSVAGPS
jgi:arylsulfatase A-like enzyme